MPAKPSIENKRARQRIAAQRAADQRRRNLIVIASSATAVVVVVVAVLVGVRLTRHTTTTAAKPSSTVQAMTGPAPASLVAQVTGISASTLDKVAAGQVSQLPVPIKNAPALTSGGKPEVVYIGAEYCPYCAAERWPMIIALSRFGTFSNLGLTHSASGDVYPNTPTFTFHGSSYTSAYLTFNGVETNTNQPTANGYTTLDTPTAAEQQLLTTYDAAPYVPASSAGSIPFADLGGKFLISGASYAPQLLAGKTQQQVAAVLDDPSNSISQAVEGTANALTTALCKLTGGKPATVCSSAAATAYQGKLG
jgi:thiol-disulfide isomerase/thioredoxin